MGKYDVRKWNGKERRWEANEHALWTQTEFNQLSHMNHSHDYTRHTNTSVSHKKLIS